MSIFKNNKMFKVAIIVGNNQPCFEHFRKKCVNILKNKANEGIFIISNGNELVRQFAERYKIDLEEISADFKKFGKDALKVRNEQILSKIDAVITFNPKLKDTKCLIEMCKNRDIPYRAIE